MNDEDQAACRRTVLAMRGQSSGEEPPARDRYALDDSNRREFAIWTATNAAKPKAAPGTREGSFEIKGAFDWVAFDERINAVILETVGPCIDRIAERTNEALDQERDERATLQDRVRELMLEQAKAAVTVGRLEVALAQLELRLATGDRRDGTIVDAVPPSLKSVN